MENCALGCLKSEFHHFEFISCMLTPLILNVFHAPLPLHTRKNASV